MSLPDPATIPETAYLIVGYTPGEDNRFTGDENEFYFLSIETSSHPRFLHINFDIEDQLKTLSENYKSKFDIVIFDYSVMKLFSPIKNLKYLFDTVKEGGYLILDDDKPGIIVYNNMRSGETHENAKKRKIEAHKNRIIETFKDYNVQITQYRFTNPKSAEFIGNLKEVLAKVYWPRVKTGSNPTGLINIFHDFVIIKKSPKCEAGGGGGCAIMGGKRRLSSRKLIKKRTKTSRRRCVRRNNH